MHIPAAYLSDQRVVALLELHAATARAQTGRGSAHALDLSGLRSPAIVIFALWDGETLVGVGALKRLSPHHGELKAMHVVEALRGRGAGSLMLGHLIQTARAHGLSRVSLETGSWPYFHPAQALYRRHGFVECGPFEGYAPDPNSVFMTLSL